MQYLLRDIYQRYEIPMIITENGLGARDVLEDGKVHDDYRIDYWTKHLQAIHRAIELGVDVRGFLHGPLWMYSAPVMVTRSAMVWCM